MKHTPGPWKSYTNYHCAGPLKGSFVDATNNPEPGTRLRVADVLSHAGVKDQAECEANARLIAAAPEMRDFVEEATCWCELLKPLLCRRCALLAKIDGAA